VASSSDHFDLLLFALQQDMRAALRYHQAKRSVNQDGKPKVACCASCDYFSVGYLHIPKDAFEARVTKELAVPHASLTAFYDSNMFSRAGYALNEALPLVILYPMPTE